MELNARFLQAVAREMEQSGLTPSAFCRAVVEVLPADGAGLSTLVDGLRIPVGASGDPARVAEEIQTSLGAGPCLAVAESHVALVADLDHLSERWPLYGSEMAQRTPFRSAGALPLRTAEGAVFAALDLYAEDPHLSARLDLDEVGREVTPLLAALLWPHVTEIATEGDLPAWYAEASARRRNVWVAVGMVVGALHCSRTDAIGRLRAHAYSRGRTLDVLADELVTSRVPVSELTD